MTYLLPLDEATPDLSRALRQALAQRGIASIDLTPVFRQWTATGEPLFFTTNRYSNVRGHALIAQEVVRHLTATAQMYVLTPWERETTQASVWRQSSPARGRPECTAGN